MEVDAPLHVHSICAAKSARDEASGGSKRKIKDAKDVPMANGV